MSFGLHLRCLVKLGWGHLVVAQWLHMDGWMIFQQILSIPSGESLCIYIYIWYKVPFLEFGLIPVDKYLVKEKTCLQPLPSSVTIVSI